MTDTSVAEVALAPGTKADVAAPTGNVVVKAPPNFGQATWVANDVSKDQGAQLTLELTAGRAYEVVATAADGSATASATIRWKPLPVRDVELTAGPGHAAVQWRKHSDEKHISYYSVDLTPRPATAQLPRRVKSAGRVRQRELVLKGLPPDFYVASVSACFAHSGGVACSDAATSIEAEVGGTEDVFSRSGRVLLLVLSVLAFICAVGALWVGPKTHKGVVILDEWALAIGGCVAAAVIGLVSATRRPRSLLSGPDGRVSTSRTNVALWTLAVAFALSTLTAISVGVVRHGTQEPCSESVHSSSTDPRNAPPVTDPRKAVCVEGEPRTTEDLGLASAFEDSLAPNYLVLLGGPFVGLVGAAWLVNRQVDKGERQKVDAGGPSRFADALTNDNGEADLVDAQYLVFTVVLLFYFFSHFLNSPYQLPDLPWGLVGLTGISALTYVTNKAVTTNGLNVDGVSPNMVKLSAPAPVHVFGRNFLPEGSADLPSGGARVLIGGYLATIRSITNTSIEVDLPTLEAGSYEVEVTTAADVMASAGTLTVGT